jgi:nitrogen regulatory protein PII
MRFITSAVVDHRPKPDMSAFQIIREYGHTGETGDGRVVLTNVEDGINIRMGHEGEAAL